MQTTGVKNVALKAVWLLFVALTSNIKVKITAEGRNAMRQEKCLLLTRNVFVYMILLSFCYYVKLGQLSYMHIKELVLFVSF